MNIHFSDGQMILDARTKDSFFEPIDKLWGSFALRRLLTAKNLSLKEDLFLCDEQGQQIKITKTALKQNKAAIGIAFTILKNIDDDKKHLYFRVNHEFVTEKEIFELVNRAKKNNGKTKQVGPLLVLNIESLKAHFDQNGNSEVVIRIGQEGSKYVLFLHDKENEGNLPLRIPPSDDDN